MLSEIYYYLQEFFCIQCEMKNNWEEMISRDFVSLGKGKNTEKIEYTQVSV